MSYPRTFVDTMPTEPARLATDLASRKARHAEHWLNRALSVLLAVAIGAGLGWWLYEWAGQCVEVWSCGLALVRPAATSTVQSLNQERLHAAVDAAYKNGRDEGYYAGYRDGGRYGAAVYLAAGAVLGGVLTIGALHLGLWRL